MTGTIQVLRLNARSRNSLFRNAVSRFVRYHQTEKAMFIFGTEDKFITEEIREKLIGEFPNVKAVVIPETGHNSFIEEPQKVLEAIENFIG